MKRMDYLSVLVPVQGLQQGPVDHNGLVVCLPFLCLTPPLFPMLIHATLWTKNNQ